MSTIKMLYEQIRLYHLTFHAGPHGYYEPLCRVCVEERKKNTFTEEEKAMAVYDHVRADELNSTEEQEEYEA
jgi:hypothetical protein